MLTPLDVPLIQFGRQVRRPEDGFTPALANMLQYCMVVVKKGGIVQDIHYQTMKSSKPTWNR